jgi:ADP-ribose pyrophosphatase YjhB (NUDIX family)
MHYIQKHILDELRTVEKARYTDLRIDGIESGHFRYHLQQLVKDGFVNQLQRGQYGLSIKGQILTDKQSKNRAKSSEMPKTITYTLMKNGDFILLQEKQKQPYMGLLNMIGGKLHEGETAEEASSREVFEKTGLHIIPEKLTGIFEIFIKSGEVLLSHTIAFVFLANITASQSEGKNLTAIKADDIEQASGLAPDFMPIFKTIRSAKVPPLTTLNIQFEQK